MKKPRHPPVVTGEVLLCAPFGKDAEILTQIASLEGLSVIHCASLSELVRRFSEITDFILLTEEALVSSSFLKFQEVLRKQERWSDVPIVLLASAGVTALSWTTQFVSKLGADANISILERPVRVPTILSVVRTAKRARTASMKFNASYSRRKIPHLSCEMRVMNWNSASKNALPSFQISILISPGK